MSATSAYFERLSDAVGQWWNRFWFTPAPATVLGLIRIGAGLMALCTIGTYWVDLHRWFDPDGMLPSEMVREQYELQWSALDHVPAQWLPTAYGVAMLVLLLFTLGIGGRAIAILAAGAVISFFARGPQVTGEFEAVLAMLMVYLCVGNSMHAFSMQALLRARKSTAAAAPVSPLNTISTRLIQIHIALIHLMTAFAQLAVDGGAWWSGEGMWLAASRPGVPLVDLGWLASHPRIVAAWSHAMLLYLLAMPVFIWKPLVRPIVLAFGVVLWFAFALASGWVMFSLAMLLGLAAFVEPSLTTE